MTNKQSLSLTASRRAVLSVLQKAHGALGAYDIVSDLSAAWGRPVAPITVYRALDYLCAHGLVHKLAARNAYLACPFQQRPRGGMPEAAHACAHANDPAAALNEDHDQNHAGATQNGAQNITPHHHGALAFLVCSACARVIEVEDARCAHLLADICGANRFVQNAVCFEISGLCQHCHQSRSQ